MDRYSRLLQELDQLPHVQGILPTDLIGLPENVTLVLRTLMRHGAMTASALASRLEVTVEQATHFANELVSKGYLLLEATDEQGGALYQVFYANARKHNMPSRLL